MQVSWVAPTCGLNLTFDSADSVDDAVDALRGKTIRQVVMAVRADDRNAERINNWLQAVKQLNADYVLLVSEPRADRGTTLLGQHYYQIEKAIQQMDLNWTVVRSMFFVDNLALYSKDIKSKKRLALPLSKKGYFAPIQAEDVSMAICSILADCQKHHGKIYELTGPKTKVSPQIGF